MCVLRAIAAALCVAVTLLSGVPARASSADQTLLLDVVINGNETGRTGQFTMRDSVLLATPEELAAIGLKVPEGTYKTKEGLVALRDLTGVTTRIDEAAQRLFIEAGRDALAPNMLGAGINAGTIKVESGIGATLNYDLTGTSVAGAGSGAGAFDFRMFSPYGVASTTAIAFAGASPTGPDTNEVIRLDSSYVHSDADDLMRFTAGDFINGGLSWTRPVRLGGVQVSHDFSMRPDLVTFPLPVVAGTASVPSTVDVLVNGLQQFSAQTQAGPFQVPQLPVNVGANTVSLAVTNVLGQQVTLTLPFYASENLLAPGLDTFSFDGGFVRRKWGVISDDYGDFAVSGTYRRGVSDAVTLESHIEATRGAFMGGLGVVANAFDFAVVNASAAGSTAGGLTGAEFAVGAQRLGPDWSLGVSALFTTRDFRDIAALNGDPIPRLQLNANAGVSFGQWGSFGVAYTSVDRDAAVVASNVVFPPSQLTPGLTNAPFQVIPAEHAKILSANYSVQVDRFSIYATGFNDFVKGGGSGFTVGLVVPIGARSSVSASAGENSGSSPYGQVQALQSVIVPGDWGYDAYAAFGGMDHQFAQADYKAQWGLVTAGVDRSAGEMSYRGELQGALSIADGSLFASNIVTDSFAIVDTDGVAGVHVLSENRVQGQTDIDGQLLVPDLRSFDINHISIDPLDVPADASLAVTAKEVRPQDRSGVVVEFPIHVSHGALITIVTKDGKPLPVGSSAELAATKTTVAVGYDGQAFVEDLSDENSLRVQMPDGRRCTASFKYQPLPGDIPKIGPITCEDSP
jgi:outer membrane usher protein